MVAHPVGSSAEDPWVEAVPLSEVEHQMSAAEHRNTAYVKNLRLYADREVHLHVQHVVVVVAFLEEQLMNCRWSLEVQDRAASELAEADHSLALVDETLKHSALPLVGCVTVLHLKAKARQEVLPETRSHRLPSPQCNYTLYTTSKIKQSSTSNNLHRNDEPTSDFMCQSNSTSANLHLIQFALQQYHNNTTTI